MSVVGCDIFLQSLKGCRFFRESYFSIFCCEAESLLTRWCYCIVVKYLMIEFLCVLAMIVHFVINLYIFILSCIICLTLLLKIVSPKVQYNLNCVESAV